MKNLSLKLDEEVFSATEDILQKLPINRNRYFNEAIAFYNNLQSRVLLAAQLKNESELVSEESLKVLHELERLADDH